MKTILDDFRDLKAKRDADDPGEAPNRVGAFATALIRAHHGIRWRPFCARTAVEAELLRRGYTLANDAGVGRRVVFYAMPLPYEGGSQ